MSYDNYFYSNEAEQYTFYRLPKILFTEPRFKTLSDGAKILYGLVLDRMGLSIKNGWVDKHNRVFIYFTVEDVQEYMNCANGKATKMLNELDTEKGLGLIERVKRGQGKPAIIYVKKFINSTPPPQVKNHENHTSRIMETASQESRKSHVLNRDNQTPRITEIECQESRKSHGNNTDINKTEFNDNEFNDHSFFQSDKITPEDYMNERMIYRKMILENIDFEFLKESYPEQQLCDIVEIILEAVCSTRPTLRIGKEEKPKEVVKSQLLKLNSTHIESVLDSLKKNITEIKYLESYILTALYKSYYTADSRYETWVNHDLQGD